MKRIAMAVILATGLAAAAHPHEGGHGAGQAAAGQAEVMTAGEVRKVDAAQNRLTIRHEPIENLGMGRMTMIFRVNDPAMLGKVRTGDRIRFHAEEVDGNLTVMRWERAE